MSETNIHTPLLDTTLTVQNLGAARPNADYPEWVRYALRTSPANVCVAEVGHVDRYYEAQYGAFAHEIARRYNTHGALLAFVERVSNTLRLDGTARNAALVTDAADLLRLARGS